MFVNSAFFHVSQIMYILNIQMFKKCLEAPAHYMHKRSILHSVILRYICTFQFVAVRSIRPEICTTIYGYYDTYHFLFQASGFIMG